MTTIEIQLDDATFEAARKIAVERNLPINAILSEAIVQYASNKTPTIPGDRKSIIGLFADQSDLLDKIVEDAYRDRQQPLRPAAE